MPRTSELTVLPALAAADELPVLETLTGTTKRIRGDALVQPLHARAMLGMFHVGGYATPQVAADACTAAGGGILLFPPGTTTCNIVVGPKTVIQGSGIAATILMSATNGGDVIQGVNFATLTGKSYASGDTGRGAYQVQVRDLTIDGNKANNGAGYGIRLWGRSLVMHNVIVQNCKNDGIWTEFTTHDGPGAAADMIEGYYHNIKSNGNDGNGWTYRGPHDSWLDNYVAVSNGGWALKAEQASNSYRGVIGGRGWNSWLNANSFYFDNCLTSLFDVTASGPYSGTGIELVAGSGSSRIIAALISGHTSGLLLRGTNHIVQGLIENCRNNSILASATAGDGLIIDTAQNCIIDVSGVSNHNAVKIVTDSGGNSMRGVFDVASGKTMLTGTMGNSSSYALTQIGGAGNAVQGRDNVFGWNLNGGAVLTANPIGSTGGSVKSFANTANQSTMGTVGTGSKPGIALTNDTVIYRDSAGVAKIDTKFVAAGDVVTGASTTAGRPASPVQGQMHFDTTLGKPIWHDGTNWKDATGATV